MRDATRIAAAGSYKCRYCQHIGPQEDGVLIVFAGNVLLAVCPGCIRGKISLSRQGGSIIVETEKTSDRQIVLASDLAETGLKTAKPDVTPIRTEDER